MSQTPMKIRGWRCIGVEPSTSSFCTGYLYAPVGLHYLFKFYYWALHKFFHYTVLAGWLDLPEGGEMSFKNVLKYWRWNRSGSFRRHR